MLRRLKEWRGITHVKPNKTNMLSTNITQPHILNRRFRFSPTIDRFTSRPFSRLSESPLFFFLVGYAILKDFSYLFGAKFTGRKFYRWRHDNWQIGQWYFTPLPAQLMSIIFSFPRDLWYDLNPFRRNKSTSRLRRTLGRCATTCIEARFVHF